MLAGILLFYVFELMLGLLKSKLVYCIDGFNDNTVKKF